ncbi:MAG: sensor histidine kinase [Chitinophagaceae bacterium]
MRTRLINIIGHVAGWLLFCSLIIGFFSHSPEGWTDEASVFSAPFLVFFATFLFLFYFNTFFLIPRLYLKKEYLLYFGVISLLFIAVCWLKPFDRLMRFSHPGGPPHLEQMNRLPPDGRENGLPPGPPDHPPPRNADMTSIVLFVTVWSISTALCIIRQWRMTEQRAAEAEADKANAELSFLKAQINPHFLFNTLNNIYSLAVTGNEHTAESILKLSNIMRYLTDEVRENYVPLQNELDCIADYIDLQRLRLGAKTTVDFSVSGNTDNKIIAPLLLMTFVENVFKYGISNHEPSEIIIRLTAEAHSITFWCRNRLFETKRNTGRTGIGLANARQRLQHLYPGKHFLDISTANGLFTVQLTLQG